jgi:hypothetical protein
MRPPRLTIHRLMLAVAVVATLIGLSLMGWRSMEYRRLAIQHESNCETLSGEIASLTEQGEKASSPPSSHRTNIAEREKALADESRSAAVYRRLIWRPWQQVRFR